MTTSDEPTVGAAGASAPSLPATPPPVPGATTAPAAVALAPDDMPADAPYIPAPVIRAPEPAEPIVFDAKAMVESQKKYVAKPAYGAMPKGTEASEEAARALRDLARRKRKRNRILGRSLAFVLVAALATGGYFAYTEFQKQNDDSGVETATSDTAASDLLSDLDGGESGPLTPLGEQAEVIEGLDTINDGASASAGGFLGAIDDAREAVGDQNGDAGALAGATPGSSALTVDVVLPDYVRTSGERLPDPNGREVYVVDADDFAAAAPDAYRTFLRTLAALPQRSPSDPAFAGFPAVANDEVIVAVSRAGEALSRVTVQSAKLNLHVDATP